MRSDEFCYSICAAFFQAGFQARQSFGGGRDSVAGFADGDQRFASDGIESGKTFSDLSSGFESGAMEFFAGFTDFVKVVDQGIRSAEFGIGN